MQPFTLSQLIDELPRLHTLEPAQRREAAVAAARLAEADDALAARAIAGFASADLAALERLDPSLLAAVLSNLAARCARRRQQLGDAGLDAAAAEQLAAAYAALGSKSRARFHILRALAEGNHPALAAFADLIATAPPSRPEEVLPTFAPLFRRPTLEVSALFPRLLDAVGSPAVAAAVLDLANYLTRRGAIAPHPAQGRAVELGALLGAVVERLHILQESSRQRAVSGGDDAEIAAAARQVADAVPLCVALCDTLATLGDRSVVGKIRPALELTHRRLQTEAAGALARLGEQEGIEALKRLCAEPIARLRALTYLEELGQADEVDAAHRTPLARAEAQLACWLSEPTQFGIPPTQLELIDQRRLYWPGYDEPQDCCLLRYSYNLPAGRVQGIGIAGPATFAVGCDLEDFPPWDIYSLYAGSQAEHAEIGLADAAQMSDQQQRRALQRLRGAAGDDYSALNLVADGRFFDELLPVASAAYGDRPGIVVLDGPTLHWYPRGPDRGPLGPTEAWWMHLGRKLLKAFNPDEEPAS